MVTEDLRKDYWALIRKTRRSGRISPELVRKTEAQWKDYADDVVEEALRIHMASHRQQRECYTMGIMRNLQKRRDSGKEGTGCRR